MVEPLSDVREGEILAQKYRVDCVLGAGAMGVVVAAHHLALDTRVAIKLLRSEMLGSEEAVARFAREARAAAKIKNEHVARVLDVGVLESGAPFMVMEFLDGADLHRWLEEHGPLPVEQAVDFVLQASEAIAEAHRLGIIHRDLKPSNLFCVPRDDGTLCVKVLDFGISKMATPRSTGASLAMTRTATVIGTPLYMSPEQMETSRGVDARTDVWALGVILFELLAGQSPFYAESLPEVCLKIATRPPPALRELRPDVPVEIVAAILKALEKDREQRCQSVADFCAAIAPFGPALHSGSAERIMRTMQAPSRLGDVMAGDLQLEGRSARRPPWQESIGAVGHTRAGRSLRQTGALGALAAAAAIIVVVSTLLILRTNTPSAQSSPPQVSAAPLGAPTVVPVPTYALGPLPIADDASPVWVGTSSNSSEHANQKMSDPARRTPAPDVGTLQRVQTAAPSPTPHRANPHAPVVQAPEQPEPSKGSNAYDERL